MTDMGSFNFHKNIKKEKANALLRYRRRQKLTTVFRFIEVCTFLIVFTRVSTDYKLPFFSTVLSGEYFRGFSVTLISPRFVFVLGNVILVVLLTQSGLFTAKDGNKNSYKVDFYDEYMKNCRKNPQNYQQIISSSSPERRSKATCDANIHSERKIRRTQSVNLERIQKGEPHDRRELRRSVTEKCRKSVNQTGKSASESNKKQMNNACRYAEDELSNEEFRRTVEDFIARRQRILREEEEFPTVSSCAK